MEYRTLEITLQYAMDLNKVNLISKMDVYAVVSISGGDKKSIQKTKTPVDHDGDSNPTWNFLMKFTVEEGALQLNRLTLDFKLVCERALGNKDIGEVHVPIKELLGSIVAGKQFVSFQVRKPSGKPKGQVNFSYHFGEKTAAAGPPLPVVNGKYNSEPVTAYPVTGPSSVYPPPQGGYAPPYGFADVAGEPYLPPTGYPPAGDAPPQGAYPDSGYGYPPPPPGYGYPPPPAVYGYPPPAVYGYPPPPPGYVYPPPPAMYVYPPLPPGYVYPPPVQQPAKKNTFGVGLGAGLLGGAIGGLLVGDMISNAADFDCGGGFDF